MFFHKAGWRMKLLVPHQKTISFESSTESSQECYPNASISTNTSRRTSWLSQNAADTPETRRSSASAAPKTHRFPPPVNGTAHSSESSLCSCDCGAKCPQIDISLSEMTSVDPRPEVFYLPPLASSRTLGDAKTWKLIFPEQISSPQHSSLPNLAENRPSALVFVPDLTFDLLEALEIEPADHEKTPTPSVTTMGDKRVHTPISKDQISQKTNERCQTAGATTQKANEAETTIAGSVTHTIALPHGISKKQQSALFGALAKTPISRTKSSKHAGLYRKRLQLLNKPSLTVAPKPSHRLWTNVTTNMADVLSGKMFRTEVDEMLDPSRISQLKSTSSSYAQRKVSSESTQTIDTESSTFADPFYLERLSARISCATPVLPVGLPIPNLPPLPAIPKSKRRASTPQVNLALPHCDTGMVYDNLIFPFPPPIPRRSSLRAKAYRTGTLPTISEGAPFTLNTRKPPPDNFTLRSTPFTLTSPLFRHSNIRIDRRREDTPTDETLDWTAFQMAISGTMDEDLTAPCDTLVRQLDETELDDLASWWSSFHLPLGTMVRDPPPRRIQRMVVYIKDSNNQEKPWKGRSPERLSAEGRTWGVKMEESEAPPLQSPESLPQSPMVDFKLPVDGSGRVGSIIPMGYNLGHDLEDFLMWETANVGSLYST